MAAKKRSKKVPKAPKTVKPTLRQKYETLAATIQQYFQLVRYRRPETHQIALPAVVTGENGAKRDGVMNIPSLMGAVLTAQGLGKEVRLEAVQNGQGGTLYVRFYSPIRMPDGAELIA